MLGLVPMCCGCCSRVLCKWQKGKKLLSLWHIWSAHITYSQCLGRVEDSRAAARSVGMVVKKSGGKPRHVASPLLQLFFPKGASERLLSPGPLSTSHIPRPYAAVGAGAQSDLAPGDWSLPGHHRWGQPEPGMRKEQGRQLHELSGPGFALRDHWFSSFYLFPLKCWNLIWRHWYQSFMSRMITRRCLWRWAVLLRLHLQGPLSVTSPQCILLLGLEAWILVSNWNGFPEQQ